MEHFELNKNYRCDTTEDFGKILDHAIDNDLLINISKTELNTVWLSTRETKIVD